MKTGTVFNETDHSLGGFPFPYVAGCGIETGAHHIPQHLRAVALSLEHEIETDARRPFPSHFPIAATLLPLFFGRSMNNH